MPRKRSSGIRRAIQAAVYEQNKIFGKKPTHNLEKPFNLKSLNLKSFNLKLLNLKLLNLKLLNLKLLNLKSLNLKLFNLKRLIRNKWRNTYGRQWEFSTLFKIFIAEYLLSYSHQ
jgi:hypothetical protein